MRKDEFLIMGQFLGLKKCATRGEGDLLALGTELARELCGTIQAVRAALQVVLIPLRQWHVILPFHDTLIHEGTYTIDWAGRIGLLRASLR